MGTFMIARSARTSRSARSDERLGGTARRRRHDLEQLALMH
jgi:hypothetical protein